VEDLAKTKPSELKQADKFILKQKTMVGRLNGLKGMAWAYALLYHTGLTASTASKKFSPDKAPKFDKTGKLVITNHIYRYFRGETSPKFGPRGKHNFDLIKVVDEDPLGRLATPWLTHPLWTILHPDTNIRHIREFLNGMPKEYTNIAFSFYSSNAMFNRVDDPRKALRVLYRMGTFEAYTAVLALLRESNLTGNRVLNEHAYATHRLMYPKLLGEPIFNGIHAPFIHFVEAYNGYYTTPETPAQLDKEPLTGITITYTSRYGIDPFKFLYLFQEDD